jgi:arginine deiminase
MREEGATILNVSTEIGELRRVLIHSPDRGLGKVVPSKAQDWLFEDIVHLDTMRRKEYDYYVLLLLWFLDKEKVQRKRHRALEEQGRTFFKPGHEDFYLSDKVLEFEVLLAEILLEPAIRAKLTSSVCGIERCAYQTQELLNAYDASELSRIFISGSLPNQRILFAPLPNLIFTRDLGVVINHCILLNKPAMPVRTRESLLAQYVFFNHPIFRDSRTNILELPDSSKPFLLSDEKYDSEFYRATLEGGDLMMVAPHHLLIGCSERTSLLGVQLAMEMLFEKGAVEKVTVIKIPKKRNYMHIDTIFTQVKKNVWVLLKSLGRHTDRQKKKDVLHFFAGKEMEEQLEIMQFTGPSGTPVRFDNLEDLLEEISVKDLFSKEPVRFIYSGRGEFPFSDREQWTDSCNLLAVREGVLLGYDRNDMTLRAFREAGFEIVRAEDLLDAFEMGVRTPETITNTLITLSSSELSRARGGFHCMSLPLWRQDS